MRRGDPPRFFTLNRTSAVITICSHCKRVISQTLNGGGGQSAGNREEPVSHGICSKCLIVLENRIREKPEYSLAIPPDRPLPLKAKDHG